MKNKIKEILKLLLGKKYRRFLSNISGLLNIFTTLNCLFFSSIKRSQRILIVYDLSEQPFSIGDFLLAQEVGQILCLKNDAKFADLAVVLDPGKPKSSDPAFNSIDSSNYLFNFSAIFPIVQFNKKIGSIYVFNSSSELMRLFKASEDYIAVWPSFKDVFYTKRYLHYIAFDEVIYPHYKKFKSLPRLEPIKHLHDWAKVFMNSYCADKVVITVNFRNNPAFHVERNLDVNVWRQFFLLHKDRQDIIFLVVCAKDEIDDSLRMCTNVIFTKDYDTTVDQDLALISVADIHMGSSSGPATVAWFASAKPYFIVRLTMSPDDFETPCLLSIGDGFYKFSFSTQFQTFFSGTETLDLLATKFDEMFQAVDHEAIKNRNEKKVTAIKSWLR